MGLFSPPFDISQPNIHNSKAEFKAEFEVAQKANDQAAQLTALFSAPYRDDEGMKGLATVLCAALDATAKAAAKDLVMETASDVVRKIAAEAQLSYITAFILHDMKVALLSRLNELREQEAAYWALKGRAPNHYARTIALCFAKLVARHTGGRPTVGVSRDGNYPSTVFCRALEEIYEILCIEASFRRHAEWAVKQLTDDDPQPEPVHALNSLSCFGSFSAQARNALNQLVQTAPKDNAP